jgi:hypothetical protein
VDDLQPSRQDALRWRIHPLLAKFLRSVAPPDAQDRWNAWFLERLPEPKDEAGYRGWHELNEEHAALAYWLRTLPDDLEWLVGAERAGSRYAILNGPYLPWARHCERLLNQAGVNDSQRSGALWTHCETLRSAGDIEGAWAAAEAKAALDAERGDNHALL